MKVVAYNIKSFEKEFLAIANQKKHEITLISNPLSMETIAYAEGKDAIIVSTTDDVSAAMLTKLADMGIKYIASKSINTDDIDKNIARVKGLKIANIAAHSLSSIEKNGLAGQHSANVILQEIANKTIKCLDLWQQNKCIGNACPGAENCKNKAATSIMEKKQCTGKFGRTY